VTPGIKFGGDFLAYQGIVEYFHPFHCYMKVASNIRFILFMAGDPQQFHSRFIIMCQDDNRRFPELHIKSQLRLANTVKKTLLIACFKQGTETLVYAIPRSGFNSSC